MRAELTSRGTHHRETHYREDVTGHSLASAHRSVKFL
jgi:hypothetical protein